MPIYEYERADGTRFEIRQGFHDNALTVDPETGQAVRRILSPAPIIFKGSGWYITDSRPSSASSESSASASSSTTESKPAASTTDSATATPAASAATESKPAATGATASTATTPKKDAAA